MKSVICATRQDALNCFVRGTCTNMPITGGIHILLRNLLRGFRFIGSADLLIRESRSIASVTAMNIGKQKQLGQYENDQ